MLELLFRFANISKEWMGFADARHFNGRFGRMQMVRLCADTI